MSSLICAPRGKSGGSVGGLLFGHHQPSPVITLQTIVRHRNWWTNAIHLGASRMRSPVSFLALTDRPTNHSVAANGGHYIKRHINFHPRRAVLSAKWGVERPADPRLTHFREGRRTGRRLEEIVWRFFFLHLFLIKIPSVSPPPCSLRHLRSTNTSGKFPKLIGWIRGSKLLSQLLPGKLTRSQGWWWKIG